jgi:hypothetical protein
MSTSRLSAATIQAVPLLLLIALGLFSQRQVLSLELTGVDTPLLLSASEWAEAEIPPAIYGPALGDPILGINFFRPLTALSYGANLHTTGLDPLAYHLVDLALHVGVVLLLFLVARQLLPTPASLASALIFALHPLLVEVVPDVSRRGDVLAALLILATLLAELRGHRRLSPLLCALALLAKETGLVAALLLVWARLRLRPRGPGEGARENRPSAEPGNSLRGLGWILLCTLTPLLLRWIALEGWGGYQWRAEEWRLIAHAVDSMRLLVDPAGWLPLGMARIAAIATVVLAMWLAGTSPRVRPALEVGILGIAFTIAAMSFTGRWVRPHLYLAVLFAAMVTAAAMWAGWSRGGPHRRAAVLVSFAVGVALSCSPLWSSCQEWHAASRISRGLVEQLPRVASSDRPLRIVGLPDRVLPLPGPGLRAHHVGVFTARGLKELLRLRSGQTVEVEALAYLNVPAAGPRAGVTPQRLDPGRLRAAVTAPARLALPPPQPGNAWARPAGGIQSVWWVPTPGLRYRWLSLGRPHHVEFLTERDSDWWDWPDVHSWNGDGLQPIAASHH